MTPERIKFLQQGWARLEPVPPAVEELGPKHVRLTTKPKHCDNVGEARLWTLEQDLVATFAPAVMAAWDDAHE